MWELTDVELGRGGSKEGGGSCAAVSGVGPAEGSASLLRVGTVSEDDDEDDDEDDEAFVSGAGGAGEAGDCNIDRGDDEDDDDDDAFPLDGDCHCRERLVEARARCCSK